MSTIDPESDLDQRWAGAVAAAFDMKPAGPPPAVCCCSTFTSNGVAYVSIDAACRLHGLGADANVKRWARKFIPDGDRS